MDGKDEAVRRRALERLPDTLTSFHARSLLASGRGSIEGDPDAAFVVVDAISSLAVPCFRPSRELAALPARRKRFREAVAPLEDADFLREALPRWTHQEALFYTLSSAGDAPRGEPVGDGEAVMLDPGRADVLVGLPESWCGPIRRAWERGPVAAVLVDGKAVAVCSSFCETETHWDVSIDTLESHRRRGFATAAAARLIRHQRERGREPLWGTTADNRASRELAAKLGFREEGRLAWALSPESA